ncbi:MAG: sigma 54-interacting transcriptional regulator [Deltaproteobacteria bacterium]|nr:sigma 54-interacting transcriptional regulator [Deltaproteobacteria bacterium]
MHHGNGTPNLVGISDAFRHVLALARRVVEVRTTVLLQGPSGTGKELLARMIHDQGPRRSASFVAVNCGAFADGLLTSELFGHRRGAFTGAVADRPGIFEVAAGGTVFLDEIAEASPSAQVHMLRVLQEGEIHPVGATHARRVDVRVIAATNRDLRQEVSRGRFREDLFFRLNVFPIRIPPLRERREDIPPLIEHFLRLHGERLDRRVAGIDRHALDALTRLDLPGNVRELSHVIERALLLCAPGGWLTTAELFDELVDLPPTEPPSSLEADVGRFERERIRLALDRCDGNRTHAARELGLTYRGLLKKMHRLGLRPGAGS